MIYQVIFNKYLVCFWNNDSKCVHRFSVDDNTNNRIFFTTNTSTCKCSFLWQMVGDSILVIMYDTKACTSGAVISRMNKILSIRLSNNHLSLSDMLGESAFNLNLWLNPKCGKQPGIDISLMMCDCFFVIFQQTIGMDVLVSMSGYLFLSSLLYNRCCCGFKSLLLLGSTDISYSGSLILLNFLFCRHDFFLLTFFFDIDLCRPTLLIFVVGYRITSFKITSSTRLVFESTWLRTWWSGKLIFERLSYSKFVDKSLLPMLSSSKCKRDNINFIYPRTVISWRWFREQSIRFCLQGEGVLVLPLFLLLTIIPLYGMLVELGLYRDPRHLNVWRRLCLPDLQFCTLYPDFIHARRFCANLPAPLLDLLWFWVFWFEV